jgi:tRNA threonylcarbamoyladenosine biosynthesis protein TsaE
MGADPQKTSSLEFLSHSVDETLQFGEILSRFLAPGIVLALFGHLGSGKTVLCKGICRGLGIPESQVTSPTFTIMNIYQGRVPVFHFDFYRLERDSNWWELGLDEYFYDEGIVLIEWPDRLGEQLPDEAVHVHIRQVRPVAENTASQRKITIRNFPGGTDSLLKELRAFQREGETCRS